MPDTAAAPVAGEIPATWKYETERFFVPEEAVASKAPTVRYFASYAPNVVIMESSVAEKDEPAPLRATLNFSGLSFSLA